MHKDTRKWFNSFLCQSTIFPEVLQIPLLYFGLPEAEYFSILFLSKDWHSECVWLALLCYSIDSQSPLFSLMHEIEGIKNTWNGAWLFLSPLPAVPHTCVSYYIEDCVCLAIELCCSNKKIIQAIWIKIFLKLWW